MENVTRGLCMKVQVLFPPSPPETHHGFLRKAEETAAATYVPDVLTCLFPELCEA